MSRQAQSVADRFHTKYIPEPNSGCWLWDGMVDKDGYGRMKISGGMHRAHRVSYELHIGPISEGLLVCHRCDVPGCVNPQHLFLGTARDNTQDMISKRRKVFPAGDAHWSRLTPERVARGDRHSSRTRPERVPRGERSGTARLTLEQVQEVRAMYGTGDYTLAEVGAKYGISYAHVSNLFHRKRWSHL